MKKYCMFNVFTVKINIYHRICQKTKNIYIYIIYNIYIYYIIYIYVYIIVHTYYCIVIVETLLASTPSASKRCCGFGHETRRALPSRVGGSSAAARSTVPTVHLGFGTCCLMVIMLLSKVFEY